MQAIAELGKQLNESIDGLQNNLNSFKQDRNVQFEAVRQYIVDNNIRIHKLEGNFHFLSAEVSTLIEEVRHKRKVLV